MRDGFAAPEYKGEPGGPSTRRYRANGLVAGYWEDGLLNSLVLLDGTRCKAAPEVKLRRWLEGDPSRARTPARWIVYPRPVKDETLEFFVVGQRNALAGESENKINRELDRFIFSGTVLNVRVKKQKLVLRIGRNELAPSTRKARFHPAWRTRTVFLHGTAGVPQSAVGKEVTVTCRREGSKLVAFHWKPNLFFFQRWIDIGVTPVFELPWPWRPSSQTLWRLCTKEWDWKPAELAGAADVDMGLLEHTIDQLIHLQQVLDVELYHLTPTHPASDLFKNEKWDAMAEANYKRNRHLLHIWMKNLQKFLHGLPESERSGLLRKTKLIPMLVAAVNRYEAQVRVEPVGGGFHLFLDRNGDSAPIRGGPRTKLLKLLCLKEEAKGTTDRQKPMTEKPEVPARPVPTESQLEAFTERIYSIAKAYDLAPSWVRIKIADFIAGDESA